MANMDRPMASNGSKPQETLWSRRLRTLVPQAITSIVALLLLAAHFNQGTDDASTSIQFSICFSALLLVLMSTNMFRGVSYGMAIIAALFTSWLALGFFGSWHQAKYEILTLSAAGALAGIGYLVAKQNGDMKFAWSALTWTLLIWTTVSLGAHIGGLSNSEATENRLSGGFGSPNTAATLFGLAILMSAAKIISQLQSRRLRNRPRGDQILHLAQHEYPSFVLMITAGTGLLLTVSRAGIVLGLLSLFALVAFEFARIVRQGRLSFLRRREPIIAAAVMMTVVLALAVSGDINLSNTEGLLENADSRASTAAIYWQSFLERPWFGYGLGGFNAINDASTTIETASVLVPLGAAHNVVLQWLLQQGILGTSMMATVIAIVFYPIIAALRSHSKRPRNFLRFVIAATVLVFAHGLVDYALEIPSVMWTYAFILGLGSGYAARIRVRKTMSEE